MSGPKVVRVVTREERIEACTALVARLDAELASLKRECTRLADAKGLEIASSTERRESVVALIQQNSFDAAESRAQQEIAFIKATRAEIVDRAAKVAAAARQQSSRRRQAASELARELERKLPGKHVELIAKLKDIAAKAKPGDDAEALLSRAMLALAPDEPNRQLSDSQREMARSLQTLEPDAPKTTSWKHTSPPDKRIVDLQQRLSQMDVLGGEESAASFSARLSQLELEPESANRSMKLDGLLIDVASHVDALKVWSATVDKAQLLLAEAAMWSEAGNLSVLAVQLQVAVSERDLPRILALEPLVVAALGQTRQQAAADARRKAILSGLAELGYQVNESMSTSWVRDGRVVLKKSAHDQHGVEVASAADAQRLQVRTVALAESRTRSSDLAAETAWCGDFSKLQEHLKAQDGELAIEMAKGVGAVPLKVVLPPPVEEANAPAVSAPKLRQLR